jgi:hypothetical protein
MDKSKKLGIFLWGYVKNIVYAERVGNLQELRHRITAATATLHCRPGYGISSEIVSTFAGL